MYVPGGKPRGEYLASQLVMEALFLGAHDVCVQHVNGWWLVSSSSDWLVESSGEQLSILFSEIVPLPEAGDNSMRAEVLLTAFAQDVVTFRGRDLCVITGRADVPEPVWQLVDHLRCLRMVAFRTNEPIS